ncbi:MAG: OstA-like protein, partial [Putridiphycobacter sp.]|nr:OstA-like protein [Putridiphycobacter sp.]
MTTFTWSQKNNIELVHADTLANSSRFTDATKLVGNVHFKNQNLNLYCDSAFFHQVNNWVKAYGRVQINQGDTLNLYADSLHFDGNTNIGQLQSNVKIRDNLFKLRTDSLNFNANTSVAYYTNKAFIESKNNQLTLTSKKGKYFSSSKTFIFKDSVILNHPDYLVHSDTLEFRAV